jgi:hypothetical protein
MEEQVMAFVARECGIASGRIKLSSDLAKDFGVAGDDGVELMSKYAHEFDVELTGFNPIEFFGSETAFILFAVFYPSWWKRKRHRKSLTVGDLVEMARCRSWESYSASKR